jgi:hypothetical protein
MRSLPRNFLLALVLCSVVSFLVLAEFNYPLTGIDDANIYFVYAKNLAGGHGFVYNVGGERVDGFTSPLWTLISALAFRWSSHPEMTLLMISVMLLSLGMAIALSYLQNDFVGGRKTRGGNLPYPALFLILLLSSPRYLVWNTITLMENALWSTLLLVTTIFVIKQRASWRTVNLGFMPLSVLLILTRPESMLWGTVFLGILFARLTFHQDSRTALRTLAPSILCLAGSIIVVGFFELLYFGYPLPNTFYAKVSPDLTYNLQQGAIYLSKYVISDPIVFLSVVAMVISGVDTLTRILSKRRPEDGSYFLPILAGTGLLAPLITGGDHFGSFRLYQNIYPIEILCLLYFTDRVLPRWLKSSGQSGASPWNHAGLRSSLRIMAIGSLVVFQVGMWKSVQSELKIEFAVAAYGRKNGAFIQELFSPLSKLPSLGVVTSGGIKYSYAGEIVDLMGLNNTLMAHNQGDRKGIKNHAAFDIPTFYKLQPDVVWPQTVIEQDWQYSETGIQESWENREGLKGLFDEPRFLELYGYAKVSSKIVPGYALAAWFRKDLLAKLRVDPQFRIDEYPYSP